jgi:site-specific DNA recombinase
MDRPALERLLADIKAGKVDCVVVYKVDRLSRSLLDFAKIMEVFDQQHVAFVSVTQQFNTSTPMGRLVLNVLLSFAQFEREIIGERIRDKIAAQRRKGKWAGGTPVLGYDVDRSNCSPKLVVNTEEAVRVREIFGLYLESESLLPVVNELVDRGWCNKSWKTKKGLPKGGRPFDKCSVYNMLTNPIYVGEIKHKAERHDGEHPAIVPPEVFGRVQKMLHRNGRTGGSAVRNRYGALLKGLLFCTASRRTRLRPGWRRRAFPPNTEPGHRVEPHGRVLNANGHAKVFWKPSGLVRNRGYRSRALRPVIRCCILPPSAILAVRPRRCARWDYPGTPSRRGVPSMLWRPFAGAINKGSRCTACGRQIVG